MKDMTDIVASKETVSRDVARSNDNQPEQFS
jgi:hypothetical protein